MGFLTTWIIGEFLLDATLKATSLGDKIGYNDPEQSKASEEKQGNKEQNNEQGNTEKH